MKISKSSLKEEIDKITNKAKDWLNTEGQLSEYNTNGIVLSYIAAIVIIVGLVVSSLLITTYDLAHDDNLAEFTETVEVTVVSTKETGSGSNVKYKTVLEYLDEKYVFKDAETYSKCKGMDGLEIEWELSIIIDSKGDISYELVDLDSD